MTDTDATAAVLSAADEDALVAAAAAARLRAYAPYSRFLVGAALLCRDGTVVSGCNVENASYGLCVCAERNAINTAVGQGKQVGDFVACAVITASAPPSPPCGMCRQVLSELGGADLIVVLTNTDGAREHTTLGALFPGTFTPALLSSGQDR